MNYFSNTKKSAKEKRPIMCFDNEITLKRIKSYTVKNYLIQSAQKGSSGRLKRQHFNVEHNFIVATKLCISSLFYQYCKKSIIFFHYPALVHLDINVKKFTEYCSRLEAMAVIVLFYPSM